jgi:cyclophilin family peptidyl-prolyl cis-trans isomerase
MKKTFQIIALFFFGIAICSAQAKKTPVKKAAAPKTTVAKPALKTVTPTSNEGVFVEMKTSKGLIVLQLEYKKTPITVANFVSLIEGNNPQVGEQFKGKPFFDGLKFHRVIANFMIQGGDPQGNGSGGPGYAFKDEFDPTLVHDKGGILSMANSGPKTNGSQFFITHKETAWLNNKHSVFGHVVTGMDVVNAIAQDDKIEKVTVKRVGADAKKFDAVKVFSDYFANKAEDDKKQALIDAENKKKQDIIDAENKKKQALLDAEAKRVYVEKYGTVLAAKVTALQGVKAKATKTASGLEYVITEKGTGTKPEAGKDVAIKYSGFLEDGTLFDSSIEDVAKLFGKFDQNRANANAYVPIQTKAGQYQFIQGFAEGLNLLNIGDKATFFIPSNLAYGERGAGNVIPPNSNIIFEVEFLEGTPATK